VTARAVATAVRADGSAVLSAADLVQVLGALDCAEDLARDRACAPCADCAGSAAALCGEHAGDFDQADEWQAVAARLGADPAASRPAELAQLALAERAAAAGPEVAALVVDALGAALEASERLAGIRAVLAVAAAGHGGGTAALERIADIAGGGRPGRVKQAFSMLPGLPGRDDAELAALAALAGGLPAGGTAEVIRSLLRCALGQERTGDPACMATLAADVLVTLRLRGSPETARALDAARPGDGGDR
jgi:hypothetical protein